jgi:hypothetical protein
VRALWLLLLAPPLLAQPARTGTITGTVYDSLFARAPLVDAEVLVEGLPRTVRTDSLGRFRVDSVPPGAYRIAFFHASFDAVDLQPPPSAIAVVEEQATEITLAIPDVSSAYGKLCGQPMSGSDALIVGIARAIGTNDVVPIARLNARWTEVAIRSGVFTRESPTKSARVTETGAFVLCGVPFDAELSMSAITADGRAAVTAHHPTGARAMMRVLRVAAQRSPAERAVGLVVREDGAPITNAVVSSPRDTVGVRSDSLGRVALVDSMLAAGELSLRALGYRPLRATVDADMRVLTMTPEPLSAQELAAVRVAAQRVEGEGLQDFEARRRTGHGKFFTREQIARRNPMQLSFMLDGLPNLLVDPDGRVRNQRGGLRGACEPTYFVDGVRINAEIEGAPPLNMIPPETVAGMEVYRNVPEIPLQFGGSQAMCGVIVIWTKRGGK